MFKIHREWNLKNGRFNGLGNNFIRINDVYGGYFKNGKFNGKGDLEDYILMVLLKNKL